MANRGIIRSGMGGWNFEPWQGVFYPEDLPKKRQLEYATRQVTTIEVNATYYRGQKPETVAGWGAEAPDGFVFSIKGNRFVTNKKVLGSAADSLSKFFAQQLSGLGPKLGPILWQFAPTKKFEADDFEAFLKLLPAEENGVRLRHALEVRHESFIDPAFVELAAAYRAAIVYADHFTYPAIADVTADFIYARLQTGDDSIPTAYSPDAMDAWAKRAITWAEGGIPDDLPLAAPDRRPEQKPRDVFLYFIHEGKIRAPHAAIDFLKRVEKAG
jgi:uncharacterized protein YecE (DUF72 family)